MKKFIETIQGFFSRAFDFIGADGLLHLETSALIVLACPRCIGYWSILIAAVIGILKEIYDITVKKSAISLSWPDLICDAIGIVIGVVIGLYR